MLALLQTSPTAFVIAAVVLLYSLVLHELAHALVAWWAGDPTARNLGRISLDPLRHLDPLGSVLLLTVGFGWAKPVPVRPDRFRHERFGSLAVALAGVVANLALATAALVLLRLGGLGAAPGVIALPEPLLLGLQVTVRINVLLAVFNLLPVPPLDGSRVVAALLPKPLARGYLALERFGFLVVIVGLVLFPGPLYAWIDAATGWLARLILG